MGDRLAELEGVQDALHDIPDDISVPVSAGLARDLLAVAKAAREFIDLWLDMNGEPPTDPETRALHDALANLEGDAT